MNEQDVTTMLALFISGIFFTGIGIVMYFGVLYEAIMILSFIMGIGALVIGIIGVIVNN
jgi:hypothetical protein